MCAGDDAGRVQLAVHALPVTVDKTDKWSTPRRVNSVTGLSTHSDHHWNYQVSLRSDHRVDFATVTGFFLEMYI